MITGEQIKQAREALGLRQKPFAERFGLNQATLCRWETKGVPVRAAAQALARSILQQLEQAA